MAHLWKVEMALLSGFRKEWLMEENTAIRVEQAGFQIDLSNICRTTGSAAEYDWNIQGVERDPGAENDGIRFTLTAVLDVRPETTRMCIPSMIYSEIGEETAPVRRTFMEDRLTGVMVLAFDQKQQKSWTFTLETPALKVEEPIRKNGESHYLQKTETISVGYRYTEDHSVEVEAAWPYGELDTSSALSADERPAVAYYPLSDSFEKHFTLRLEEQSSASYTSAVLNGYASLAERLEKRGERVIQLPFTREEGRKFRLISLGKSYREFEEDGAGFFFHFDPKYGYGSRPSGFSTCYDTIPHNSYPHILEYGFTGRQINAAYLMAREKGGEWIGRAEKVIDFFLKNCQLENGWVYSLYDLETRAPFFSFGDPDAPKLHYISRTRNKGNYLRTMTEPMNDLLVCYEWFLNHGMERPAWKEAFLRYADFLLQVQNPDGSWFRAYCPDGTGTDAIDRPELTPEEAAKGQKSVTSIPLVFLSGLCRLLDRQQEDSACYRNAAVRAGHYVLADMVAAEHYQGATLDNPNQVDKEAAQYVMAGLCRLYQLTGDSCFLKGAESAASLFVTWNYIWNAPMGQQNILEQKNFHTKGMGAINSVWGGGVVDIYSLFHVRELDLVGELCHQSFFRRMAEWISIAPAQILSYPSDWMDFKDLGMQPEGFGICPQGMDEGMIHKGDIWGTLGWIYSAGIDGLGRYLEKV